MILCIMTTYYATQTWVIQYINLLAGNVGLVILSGQFLKVQTPMVLPHQGFGAVIICRSFDLATVRMPIGSGAKNRLSCNSAACCRLAWCSVVEALLSLAKV